ncbi:MAG TPA: glycosyltransferase [Solirubrobacteraceae bacterium]|jgi:UDP-N-acetylglucosamine:LPS N-acetylglucosamine transferase
MATTGRVLVLSAAIGEGHDLPARWLAAGLAEEDPAVEVEIADGLAAMGAFAERVVLGGSSFESVWGNWLFDLTHWLITAVRPIRAVAGIVGVAVGGRGLRRLVAERRADVVVSTYPGVTEVLGRLRRSGRLRVPVVSAITDLASLRYWAHPGVDLHLVTHAESIAEVRAIAGPRTDVVAVRGLNDPAFLADRLRADARRALGLPAEAPVVVVSGGGWGVGDLGGAVDSVLAVDGAVAVVMCGRNDALRERLAARYAAEPRVRPLGFTDRVPDLFAAADALVHSTAGLTVLEALARGCPVISYGWGRGHIRANNRAYRRFGLADVATTRPALEAALRRALAAHREPDRSQGALPTAAGVVLARFGLGAAQEQVAHPG